VSREEFFATWSALHGGAKISGFVKGWLHISYLIVRPLDSLRISPNFITLLGLGLGVLTWCQSHHLIALIYLLLSLIADGIDGSLAIIREKVSLWGAELDSIVDRLVEFFWALSFYRIGAPVIVVGVAWAAALTQEYARARAAGLGHRTLDVVTVAERPVRAIFLAVAMALYFVGFERVILVEIVAVLWMVLQCGSLVVVLRDSYSALQSDN